MVPMPAMWGSVPVNSIDRGGERGGGPVEIGQPDPRVGQPVQIGGVDLAAEGADIGEPEVICDDHQEVRPCHGEASCQVHGPNGTFRLPPIRYRPAEALRLNCPASPRAVRARIVAELSWAHD